MTDDFRTVARTILCLMDGIKASQSKSKLASLHMETLKVHIRGFIDRYWADKLCVSEACHAQAQRDGIADIRRLEPRDVPAAVRNKYHLEHYLQVDDLRSALLEMNNPSIDAIVDLISIAPIKKVWLLKEEDDKLPRGRRHDPANVYKEAGIVIIE